MCTFENLNYPAAYEAREPDFEVQLGKATRLDSLSWNFGSQNVGVCEDLRGVIHLHINKHTNDSKYMVNMIIL